MSSTSAVGTTPTAIPAPIIGVNVRTVMLLAGTAFLALLAYYFIGVDEGAMSVFGKSMVVHEFFHDGRHFLGFPCH
jgi:hypothetical protein